MAREHSLRASSFGGAEALAMWAKSRMEGNSHRRQELGLRQNACSWRGRGRGRRRVTGGCRYYCHRDSSASGITIELGLWWNNVRKVVLVQKDCIVRWPAHAELHGMAVEIIVEVGWTDYARIDDCASGAVSTAVGISPRGGNEYDLVVSANNDQRNFRVEAQFGACICGVVGRRSSNTSGG